VQQSSFRYVLVWFSIGPPWELAEKLGRLNYFGEIEMPELRGVQATDEVKEEWTYAYKLYKAAPGDRNPKNDRAARIDYVAEKMNLTHKQAKRRVRNYESWQRNIKKRLVDP
jgi:hypothetical protein